MNDLDIREKKDKSIVYIADMYDEIIRLQAEKDKYKEALKGMVNIFRESDGCASIKFDGLTYALDEDDYQIFLNAVSLINEK